MLIHYPNEIGPGIYDIHSPRVPEIEEMADLFAMARQRFADSQLWINPDCGFKTRSWDEVRPALTNMISVARQMRQGGQPQCEIKSDLDGGPPADAG